MGSRAAVGLLLAVIAACPAGCGGGRAAPAGRGPSDSAAVLFSQACGACHSLTGRNDPRRQGGDLLAFHSSRAQMTQLAAEMPVRRALDRSQLQAVVSFVMAATRSRR
jgi:mono/diheme cytochrome c family protein